MIEGTEKRTPRASASGAALLGFFFPPYLSGFWSALLLSDQRVAVLQSALRLLDLTCRALESRAFAEAGRCVKQAPGIRGGVITRGVGTGAFMKAVRRGLRVFTVIYVFKIGNKFLGLLTCVPSILPWLQPSIPAALTRGAASRTAFSSGKTATSASAGRATS